MLLRGENLRPGGGPGTAVSIGVEVIQAHIFSGNIFDVLMTAVPECNPVAMRLLRSLFVRQIGIAI